MEEESQEAREMAAVEVHPGKLPGCGTPGGMALEGGRIPPWKMTEWLLCRQMIRLDFRRPRLVIEPSG